MPSSFAEQSIPADSTPRIVAFAMTMPPGSRAPGSAQGDLHADGRVRRAADDRERRTGARVDAADAQALGVGMRRDRVDPRDHDAGERRCGACRVLDFEARHRQRIGEPRAVQRRIDERAQPVFGEFHRGLRYANCLRKRRSFS